MFFFCSTCISESQRRENPLWPQADLEEIETSDTLTSIQTDRYFEMAFKLGIVVGHTATSAGATGTLGLPPEYNYHREVADSMVDFAKQTYGTASPRPPLCPDCPH